MTVFMRRAAVVAGVVALLAAPTAAQGVSILKSFSGSDYSVNSSDGKTVQACDNEADSHAVRAEWVATGSTATRSVTNGAGKGKCVDGPVSTVVYKHRIVEIVPASRDDFGDYVFPS